MLWSHLAGPREWKMVDLFIGQQKMPFYIEIQGTPLYTQLSTFEALLRQNYYKTTTQLQKCYEKLNADLKVKLKVPLVPLFRGAQAGIETRQNQFYLFGIPCIWCACHAKTLFFAGNLFFLS